jgi:hypothetical protein
MKFNEPYTSTTMNYQRLYVQGFLKKEAHEKKLFQAKTYYKRYFVLDHKMQAFRIHKTNNIHSEFKAFTYSDIQRVTYPPEEDEKNQRKDKLRNRWEFKFHLQTTERIYILCAASYDERLLFVHTFKWIVEINAYQTDLYFQKKIASKNR